MAYEYDKPRGAIRIFRLRLASCNACGSTHTENCWPAERPAGTITLWYEPSGAATRTSSPPEIPPGTVTVSRVVTAPTTYVFPGPGSAPPGAAICIPCIA
eukprot:scaffold212366_cov37-Tisochrysis_lutea.AAC.3